MSSALSPFHPIHLCQPDPGKSCSACCGLYNWKDHSRAALESILAMQTELLSVHLPEGTIDAYRAAREKKLKNTKLCHDIYNCEFIGFLNQDHTRVGCLAHPAVNNGRDFRDLCLYGHEICHNHFCPAYSCLSIIEQTSVVLSIDDWYLYGLTITDIDLVKDFFKHVENRIGDSIKEKHIRQPEAQRALKDFFMLKLHWPYKARQPRLGKYYFTQTEYAIARIEYHKRWGILPSIYDSILVSLESDFASVEELRTAEHMIEEKILLFIHACGLV